jgi:hypothetical protein
VPAYKLAWSSAGISRLRLAAPILDKAHKTPRITTIRNGIRGIQTCAGAQVRTDERTEGSVIREVRQIALGVADL